MVHASFWLVCERIPYNLYKLELDAWTAVTDVPKEKWGQYVALSLPPNDPSDIHSKVFNSLMKEDKLKGEAGYTKLVEFLDKEFKKDEVLDVFTVRKEGTAMKKYISDFEVKYREAKIKVFRSCRKNF